MTTPQEPYDLEAEKDDLYDRAFEDCQEFSEDGAPRDGAEVD